MKKLPPCDHDECGPTGCKRAGQSVPLNSLVGIGFEYPLSNDELAKAIARANQSAGSASDTQKLWFRHLETLLTIQKLRAETSVNSNDLASGWARDEAIIWMCWLA